MERAEMLKFSSLLFFIFLNRKVGEFCLLMDLEKRKVEDATTKALEYEKCRVEENLEGCQKAVIHI